MTGVESSREADRPTRRPDVEWVTLDGEAVLYDPTGHILHRLNAAATAVWAACNGRATPAEIIRVIDGTYEGSPQAIARDVPVAIDRFRRLGLLHQAPDGDEVGR
jgi:Coenzyme PQQ synthesis protein D (PqqD)